MHGFFHPRQLLLVPDRARRFPRRLLVMVLFVLINHFHGAGDHSFEPAAF